MSVTDESGRPVTNLDRDDFALREDGEIRAIHTFLAPSNTPLEVALVSDRSDSMDIGYDKVAEAAHVLLGRLDPNDCVRFSAFGGTRHVTDWMRPDHPVLHEAIDTLWPGGPPALYDAILDSQVALARRSSAVNLGAPSEVALESDLLDLFRFERFYREVLDSAGSENDAGCGRDAGGSRTRQAILVVSNGVDSASSAASKGDVLRAAAFSRVPIFAASVRPPRPSNADEMPAYPRLHGDLPTTEHVSGYLINGMGAVAESSGGDLVTMSTMTEAHRWLGERLQSFYEIGFDSRGPSSKQQADGGVIRVPGTLEVEIRGRDGLKVSFQRAIYDEATARVAVAIEATLAGFSSLREGVTDAAVATFSHAVSVDDNLAAAHFGLGQAHVERNDLLGALPHLETARHLAPWAGVVHASLARVQKALGLLDEATRSEIRTVDADNRRAKKPTSAADGEMVASEVFDKRPRLYLLVPTGADVTTYDISRDLLAAIGRAVLETDTVGLAGTPDQASLALRVRFRTDRRRRLKFGTDRRHPLIIEAILYARGGGNYDPIKLEVGDGDAETLRQQGERLIARVETLAGTLVPNR